jgi:hypothetical protein
MSHTHARTLRLALAMLGIVFTVGLVPVALAQDSGAGDSPLSRGVVATVTSIDANTDTATLKTEEGEVFEHAEGWQWHVGHKVICYQVQFGPHPQLQKCRPWESAQVHSSAVQAELAPRR